MFKAILLVRSLDNKVSRQPKPLEINPDQYVPDVDLSNDDMLYNLQGVDDIVCRKLDGRPWRGAKQKSTLLLKALIHGICPQNGTIVDFKTGVGKITILESILSYMSYSKD